VAYFGPTSGALQHFSRYLVFFFYLSIILSNKFELNQVLVMSVQQLIIHLIFIFKHWLYCLIIARKLFNDPDIFAMLMIRVNLATVYHSKLRK
jgi:hypothetical protein